MMHRSSKGRPQQAPKELAASPWASLKWDDLERWAGGRSVSRGRSYQRQGHVHDLAISKHGRLFATVVGGDRYATSAWLTAGKSGREAIQSKCTCPVGYNGCKHAVAVVAEYLDAIAHDKSVPSADENDPRWARLSGEDLESAADSADGDEDLQPSDPARPRTQRRSRTDWDRKIRQHIEAKSREELVELVWSLTERFPELREEFRERIALGEGDVDRLVKQARQELESVTAQPGWRRHWSDEGYTPDYSRLRHRLERLIELGHSDAVVPLGREIIQRGVEQVEQSDDEGETAWALSECLALVFKALAESKMPAPQRLLFAIDAHLQDDYGIIGDAADVVMNAAYQPEDWSALADELSRRLEAMPAGRDDDFHRNYERDQISGWLVDALRNAGRESEVLAIYEKKARTTGSYERLVKLLIDQERYEDAQRWAVEGIEKTRQNLPGIASSLAGALCDVARHRRQWDVVAAHAAWQFFDQPGVEEFKALLVAADKAGCQDRVRAITLQFLETGVGPVRVTTPHKGQRKTIVAAEWPLSVPEYLLPLFKAEDDARWRAGPHYGVLIDLAVHEKRPDDALRWYDKLQSGRKQSAGGSWYGGGDYGDRVAEAVAKSHPQRALEIYSQRVGNHLKQASVGAYETVAAYLRKMRPILKSLGREQDWAKLLADIRLEYRNRPRFMEILDRLEDRTILQTQRRNR
jgi:uncharacterized Zn finger protein